MDDSIFRYPPPYSGMNFPRQDKPHYMTSEGMMMPRNMQPPPMYGPRGSTIPPRYLSKRTKTDFLDHTKEFYCETCDLEFQFQVDLEDHVNEHRQCGIDGCAFFGHTAIIDRHIEQQHISGLYSKLKDLNTPEAISQWREDRRKRYPTQANVALRQQVQAERSKRGERLDDKTSRFGKRSDRRKCRTQEPVAQVESKEKKKKRKRTHKSKKSEVKAVNPSCEPKEVIEERSNTREFRGTRDLYEHPEPVTKTVKSANALSSLLSLYGSDSDESADGSTEDESECVKETKEEMEPSKEDSQCQISSDEEDYIDNSSALVDIMCGFAEHKQEKASCVNIETEPPAVTESKTEIPKVFSGVTPTSTSVTVAELENNQETKNSPTRHNSESDASDQQVEVPFKKVVEDLTEMENESKNENTTEAVNHKKQPKRIRNCPKQSKDVNTAPQNLTSKRPKNVTSKPKRQTGLNYSLLRRRKQNTMLEKLLRPDIVHERNVLLQCVRYVVENNFFGIGQPKKISE